MGNMNLTRLIALYTLMLKCRECHLPQGYCPQVRPPGPEYKPGGVVFVQINPGHIGSLNDEDIAQKYSTQHARSIAIRKATDTRKLLSLQEEFVRHPEGTTYKCMSEAFLISMSELWGWPPGKYGSTIEAHGVRLETVAALNLAQCPVPNNSYRRRQLDLCWANWTLQMLLLLQPAVIVAQGKQVWDFLHNRQMPSRATLVEGLHHADRRSKETKERLLSVAREAVHRRTGGRTNQ